MNCDGCDIGSFKKYDAAQNGTPVTNGGMVVGQEYRGATGGEPTWKLRDGSVFGLMAWEAFCWGGMCIDEGEHCEEIYGCGGTLTLKFMLQVPKGGGTGVTLTDPNGNVITGETPVPLPGNDKVDNYRIDFKIDLEAGCGTSAEVKLDDDWNININGTGATHHAASGDIKFNLECDACEGSDDEDDADNAGGEPKKID